MTVRTSTTTMIAAGACLLSANAALAQHETDIILKVQGGQIITGAVEQNAAVYPRQVFTSVLGLYGIPGATFDPGFDSETGALPPGTAIGITVRRALRRWDGQSFAVPQERLEIIRTQTIQTPAADPASCGVGDDLVLGFTSTTGRLHQHPAYQLTAPMMPGVYLLELEAWVTDPQQFVSEPFFILFSHEASPTELGDAAAWVEEHLARACYANCTRSSTPLSVDDFICFINKFALQDCYANCTRSTSEPIFNIDDFICFINRFSAGCP